jgi:hypothetical protein
MVASIKSGETSPHEQAYAPKPKRLVMFVALCLLCVLAAEELLSIRSLSITLDEGAHTYAGYEHWKARDFGVNPEHPPLVGSGANSDEGLGYAVRF